MECREETLIDRALSEAARDQIRRSFRSEYQGRATEEEGLGIALAKHFEWDGLSILKTFYAALEDANFHTWNETVGGWMEELEHGS